MPELLQTAEARLSFAPPFPTLCPTAPAAWLPIPDRGGPHSHPAHICMATGGTEATIQAHKG